MRKLFIFLSLSLVLGACTPQQVKLRSLVGPAFGTSYSIQYYSHLEEDYIREAVDSVIRVFNASVSTYHPESLISQINQSSEPVEVDDIFKEVYLMSKKVYEESNGYFDPSIGSLRNAYGFGDTKALEVIDQEVLDSIKDFVGFSKTHLDANNFLHKDHPNLYIDYNAIAKGYGVDQVAAYLESQGVSNFVVEIGGELLAKGINPERNQVWIVGIESVDSDLTDRTYSHSIKLENAALAASGNYRKFREDPETGKQFVHTINPHTGSAERTNLTSATVIAPNCALADAYATTFMAMGYEKSLELIQQLDGVEAYFTYIDENDQSTKSFMTPGMKLLLKP